MNHHENCTCLDCLRWFQAAQSYLSRGRHVCGQPIDDHRLDKSGNIQECPKQAAR